MGPRLPRCFRACAVFASPSRQRHRPRSPSAVTHASGDTTGLILRVDSTRGPGGAAPSEPVRTALHLDPEECQTNAIPLHFLELTRRLAPRVPRADILLRITSRRQDGPPGNEGKQSSRSFQQGRDAMAGSRDPGLGSARLRHRRSRSRLPALRRCRRACTARYG